MTNTSLQPNKRPKIMSSPIPVITNFVNGAPTPTPTENPNYLPITTPFSTSPIAQLSLSSADDVPPAVTVAKEAFPKWSSKTIKSRASIMLTFHSLLKEHSQELAALITAENGKNEAEALAEVAKGMETVEYAASLPQLAQGKTLSVSSGPVYCTDRRDPLGVVVCIVPFNFPMMVPMWTVPIALVMGNCVILKPSEKVPMTMMKVAELLKKSGLPDGVFGMIQGKKDVVDKLIESEDVKAVTFVGSSPVASYIHEKSHECGKRCLALGGAKNHLVALPDAHIPTTASDIVVSFAGCAGQRCMAASVLLTIGKNTALVDQIVDIASKIKPGREKGCMGPVIDEASYNRIMTYINTAETRGNTTILLDGRKWKDDASCTPGGFWIGPTVLLVTNESEPVLTEEIFGPVLSIYVCQNWDHAIAIENANPFGNAASVYTRHGGSADWFCRRFRAAMLGVNIGIPVPREPFSFGGLYGTASKYGRGGITGEGAMEFFSDRVKVTSKWFMGDVAVEATEEVADKASFVGNM